MRTFLGACPFIHFNVSMTSSNCNNYWLEKLSLLVHVLGSFEHSLDLFFKVLFNKGRGWVGLHVLFIHWHPNLGRNKLCDLLPRLQTPMCLLYEVARQDQRTKSTIGWEPFSHHSVIVGRGAKWKVQKSHSSSPSSSSSLPSSSSWTYKNPQITLKDLAMVIDNTKNDKVKIKPTSRNPNHNLNLFKSSSPTKIY